MNIKKWISDIRHITAIKNQLTVRADDLNREIDLIKAENKKLNLQVRGLKNNSKIIRKQIRNLKHSANKPIRVVFLCEQHYLYKCFKSIISEMSKDKNFEVFVVNLWCRELPITETSPYINPHIEKVCSNENVSFIESYDEKTGVWFDIASITPDFVFYNRPYEIYRHYQYSIERVSTFAECCYVPYCMRAIGGVVEDTTAPVDFFSHLDYFFASDPFELELLKEKNKDFTKDCTYLSLGYPGLDYVKEYMDNSTEKSDKFTVLWLPRWNTSEGNCSFFDYKDVLVDYSKERENVSVIFRPHPLCFKNLISNGEMTEDECETLKSAYNDKSVGELDVSGDYMPSFSKSSVLVADETSLIIEYFITGKPVVFCKKEVHFSRLMEALSPGMYIVENKEGLIKTLDDLKNGNDPLREKRIELAKKYLAFSDKTSGQRIKEKLFEL